MTDYNGAQAKLTNLPNVTLHQPEPETVKAGQTQRFCARTVSSWRFGSFRYQCDAALGLRHIDFDFVHRLQVNRFAE